MLMIVISVFFNLVVCSDIYHQKTKIIFHPDEVSDYFGYSVVLDTSELIVGAPKARSREQPISPGLVFRCRLGNLDRSNITCYPLGKEDEDSLSIKRVRPLRDFFKDDMWFGATIATVPEGNLLVCGPRWASMYSDKHLLANGACYIESKTRQYSLMPFKDPSRLAYRTDGVRREFGEYTRHLNFYAHGQLGMAVKVAGNNSILIGAPGLLQWTGGIVYYKYVPDRSRIFFSQQPIPNPYFTLDLRPDDYFGYSVESGVFDVSGTILYVAGAPRSKAGYGQVLVFEPPTHEKDPIPTRAKIRGFQLGAYFGASLCCLDINNDGKADLLIGAPNYVRKDGGLPYDQGAVFVYMNKQKEGSGFELNVAGQVSGSGESGARFGTSISDLGDIDGDGYRDAAIGAPFENDGTGVVYIYKGYDKGLRNKYAQRITAEGSRSFGMSISKGLDIDSNNCNDLAVGAFSSSMAYLYRCVPTIEVQTTIKVPDAMNLPQNATNFTALFCINAPPNHLWPLVKIDLKARIVIDPERNRAMITGDSEFILKVAPGTERCEEQVVEVKLTAELSKPITMKFYVEDIDINDLTTFPSDAARISENSTLSSSFDIQLTRDCGPDLICTPWLKLNMTTFDNPYIPGTDGKLGVSISVFNEEEPAYGATVHITLPLIPKRLPNGCSLKELNMTCSVPAPLYRNEGITWDVELEYTMKDSNENIFEIKAVLEDPLFYRNISDNTIVTEKLFVSPKSEFRLSGKALPNITISVSRDKLNSKGMVSLVHYYEVTNYGPSDSFHLPLHVEIPEEVNLSNPGSACSENSFNKFQCIWSFPAEASMPLILQLKFDLNKYGDMLQEQNTVNITTMVTLLADVEEFRNVTTILVLDPALPIWPVIVGSVAGVLLLAIIIYVMYRYGFFSRKSRDDLIKLKEQDLQLDEEPGSANQLPMDDSSRELLVEDSD